MLNRQDFSACFREQFAFWSFRVAFFTLRYSFAVFVVVKSQWRSGSSVGVPARCVTCMFTQGIDNGTTLFHPELMVVLPSRQV